MMGTLSAPTPPSWAPPHKVVKTRSPALPGLGTNPQCQCSPAGRMEQVGGGQLGQSPESSELLGRLSPAQASLLLEQSVNASENVEFPDSLEPRGLTTAPPPWGRTSTSALACRECRDPVPQTTHARGLPHGTSGPPTSTKPGATSTAQTSWGHMGWSGDRELQGPASTKCRLRRARHGAMKRSGQGGGGVRRRRECAGQDPPKDLGECPVMTWEGWRCCLAGPSPWWREAHSWRRTEQEEGRKRCREEDVLERTFCVRLEPQVCRRPRDTSVSAARRLSCPEDTSV